MKNPASCPGTRSLPPPGSLLPGGTKCREMQTLCENIGASICGAVLIPYKSTPPERPPLQRGLQMGLLGLDGVAVGGLGHRKENEFQDLPETACFPFLFSSQIINTRFFYSGGWLVLRGHNSPYLFPTAVLTNTTNRVARPSRSFLSHGSGD